MTKFWKWLSGRVTSQAAFLLIILVFCIMTIGSPLLGKKVFLGADILLSSSPWDQSSLPRETTLSVSDTVDFYYPARKQAVDRVRSGDFPYWDPNQMGGSELLATPNIGLASPLVTPYWIFPTWYAPAATKLLELIAVIVGMTLFFKRLGVRAISGAFAGVVFAFSGFQVIWTNWPHTTTAAFIPFLFWSVERLLQKRTLGASAPVAFIIGSMLVSGFPAIFLHALVGVGVYSVIRLVSMSPQVESADKSEEAYLAKFQTLSFLPKFIGKRSQSVFLLGFALLIGLALASWQIVPFVDQMSQRDLSYRQSYGENALGIKSLVTAAIPHAYGSPNESGYFGPANAIEAISFVGTSTLLLAALGLTRGRAKNFSSCCWSFFSASSFGRSIHNCSIFRRSITRLTK